MHIIERGVICILLFALAGCSGIPGIATPVTGKTHDVEQTDDKRTALVEPQSSSAIGRFNAKMIFLADQLERNVDRTKLSNTFVVTSFVNLNRIAETTPLGRLIEENLIHELQVRKWKVLEMRLAKEVVISEAGEFVLSRDIKKIADKQAVGGVVVGTYSVSGSHIILNARLIDMHDGMVLSSGQIYIPVSSFVDGLLDREVQAGSMKIIADSASGFGEMPSVGAGAGVSAPQIIPVKPVRGAVQ